MKARAPVKEVEALATEIDRDLRDCRGQAQVARGCALAPRAVALFALARGARGRRGARARTRRLATRARAQGGGQGARARGRLARGLQGGGSGAGRIDWRAPLISTTSSTSRSRCACATRTSCSTPSSPSPSCATGSATAPRWARCEPACARCAPTCSTSTASWPSKGIAAPALAFGFSFSILFREGVEAVLLIGILLGSLAAGAVEQLQAAARLWRPRRARATALTWVLASRRHRHRAGEPRAAGGRSRRSSRSWCS